MISQPTLIKSSTSAFKMHIPLSVENKIRFLCSKINSIEWSGVLFYKYKGSFEAGNLEIICKDIYVMDIGNTTYTEFTESVDTVGYIAMNPELTDCQMGLIHSHHNMATFFSGTDLETLKTEGNERNNFVSLIVNNAGTYSAAITRKLTFSKPSYQFFGEGNKNAKSASQTVVIEYFDLQIDIEGKVIDFPDISERLKEIRSSKQKPAQNISFNNISKTFDWPSMNNMNKKPSFQKPVQTSLFNEPDFKTEIKDSGLLDDEEFKLLCYKLLTGCPTLTSTRLDLDKWVKETMVPVYKKSFGEHDDVIYDTWCSNYIDFLLSKSAHEIGITPSDDIDEAPSYTEITSEIASRLCDFLYTLPANPYMDVIISYLNDYIDEPVVMTKPAKLN